MNPGTGHRPDWSRGDGRDGAEGVFETLQEFALERDMDREEKQRLAHTVAGAMNESTAQEIRNLTENLEGRGGGEEEITRYAVAAGTRILEYRLKDAVQDMENSLASGDKQWFGDSLHDIQGFRKNLEAFQSGEKDPFVLDTTLDGRGITLRYEQKAEMEGGKRRGEHSWMEREGRDPDNRQALYDAFQDSQIGMSDEHRERSAENLAGTMTHKLERDAGENGQPQYLMEARTAVGDALLRGGREEFNAACDTASRAELKLKTLLQYGKDSPDIYEMIEFNQARDTREKRIGIFQERFDREHPGMELEGLARQEDPRYGAGLEEKLDQYSFAVFETFQENWRQLTVTDNPEQSGEDVASHLRYLAGQAIGETREEWERHDESDHITMTPYSARGQITMGLAHGFPGAYQDGITLLKEHMLRPTEAE